MKLLYFFTGSCFDFTEGCKATMTRDGLPMKDACSQRVFGDAGSALWSRRQRVFGGCRICTQVTLAESVWGLQDLHSGHVGRECLGAAGSVLRSRR